MDPFKEKYFVFIVSAGRTGTRYFGETLSSIIEDTFSVHEPDMFAPRRGLFDSWRKIQTFGFYQLFFGKILQKTGIRNLSQNYLSGKCSIEQIKESLITQRRKYYEDIDEQLIIESYSGWYGCIPAIRKLYANYRIIILPREPKSWITSVMNRGPLFGRWDWVTFLGLNRLNPSLIDDKEYKDKWKRFNQFQKVCWTYKTQYEIMIKEVQGDENCLVIKFEDLFDSKDRYQNLQTLLEFATVFDDGKFSFSIPNNVLDNKIHENKTFDFPSPECWNDDLISQFRPICGRIAANLGYEG